MKIILIILNLLLAGAVLWSGARFVQDISGKSQPAAFTVKKRVPKNQKAAAEVQSIQIRQFSVPTAGEAQVKEIVELDVFNQDRCPNAGVWGGNARVEMTLVGTFRIGNTQGAVILQKNQARSNQFMQFGGMMNNPGGGMMQRRQGIGPGGPGGFGGGFNGNQGGRPGGFGGNQGGDGRRAIGGSRSIQANRDARGIVQPGQQNNNTNVTYKQYVRLGETMANGYRLAEINRNSVVLVRGSDRVELELVDASVNAKQARRNNTNARPANQTQVMQQMLQSMQNMQRAQMMQNFQMMRMQQQSMQNQQNQQGRGGTAPRPR